MDETTDMYRVENLEGDTWGIVSNVTGRIEIAVYPATGILPMARAAWLAITLNDLERGRK